MYGLITLTALVVLRLVIPVGLILLAGTLAEHYDVYAAPKRAA